MVDAARHLHPVAGAENGEVARHHHAETTRENGVDLVKAVRVLRERGAGRIDMASNEIARDRACAAALRKRRRTDVPVATRMLATVASAPQGPRSFCGYGVTSGWLVKNRADYTRLDRCTRRIRATLSCFESEAAAQIRIS
jgi:hypothetical protein